MKNKKRLVWKGSVVVLFMAMITLAVSGWFFGTIDKWVIASKLTTAGLACCIITIAILPLTIREEGETYIGLLKKYFF